MAIISGPPTISVSAASFTGPAEALEVVGDHAYGYNQQNNVNNTTVTMFSFTSGNYLFVGTLAMGRNMKSAAEAQIDIKFNGSVVYSAKYENGVGNTLVMPVGTPLPLIIPAYTEVEITIANDNDDSYGMILSGRIYRD